MYSVFRSSPPSVGFAQLSTLAGGTGTGGPGLTSGSPVAGGSSVTGTLGASSPTGISGMCFLCSEDQSFLLISFPSQSFKYCYTKHRILFIPYDFNGHYCYHVMSLSRAGLCIFTLLPNRKMSFFLFMYLS